MFATIDPSTRRVAAEPRESRLVLEPLHSADARSLLLRPGKYVVGTAADCALQLVSEGVQPHHCLLVAGPSRTAVKAWDKRTWINDVPVREAELRSGDRLTIGPLTFRVRTSPPITDTHNGPTSATTESAPTIHRRDAAAPRAEASSALALRAELETHLRDLERQIEHHERQLAESLAKQIAAATAATAATAAAARQQHAADDAERQAATARRQTALVAMLQEELQQHALRLQQAERDQRHREEELTARQRLLLEREEGLSQERSRLAADRGVLEQQQDRQAETVAAWDEGRSRLEAALSARQAELESQRTTLNQEWDDFRREQTSLQQLREQLEREQQTLREQRTQLEQQLDALELSQGELRRQRSEWESDRDDLMREARRLDDERKRLLEEWDTLQAEREELQCQRLELQADRHQLDAAAAEWQQTRHQASSTEANLLADQRATLDADRAALAGRQQQLADQQANLEREWQRLEQERQSLEEARRQFENQPPIFVEQSTETSPSSAALDEVARRHRELDEWETRLRAEADALATQQEELRTRKNMLANEESMLASRRLELDRLFEKADAERVQLDAERQALTAERTTLTEEQHRRQRAREELEADARRWETARRQLELREQELNDALTTLATDRAAIRAEWESLEQERDAVLRERAALQAESSELEERQRQLAEAEADFEARRNGESEQSVESISQAVDPEARQSLEADTQAVASGLEDSVFKDTASLTSFVADFRAVSEERPAYSDDAPMLPVHVAGESDDAERGDVGTGPELGIDFDQLRQALAEDKPFHPHPEPTGQGSACSVRSALAERFNLPELTTAQSESPVEVEEVEEEEVQSEPTREPEPPRPVQRETELMSARFYQPAEPEPVASSSAASVVLESVTDSTETHDPDSVEAYMERLLARNRRGSPAAVTQPEPVRAKPRPAPEPKSVPVMIEEPSPVAPVSMPQDVSKEPAAPPTPRHKQDKESLRADLRSMRELANLSARSAIANHTWRRLRGTIYTKAALVGTSFITTVWLATGTPWLGRPFPISAGAAGATALFIGAGLLRTVLLLHHGHRLRRKLQAGATIDQIVAEEAQATTAE